MGSIRRAWQRLSQNGTAGLSMEEARKVRSLNQFVVVAIASLLVYALGFANDWPGFALPIAVNLGCAMLHLSELHYLRRGWRALAVGQFLVLLNAQIAFVSHFAGRGVGFHYFFLTFVTVPALVVPRRLRVFHVFTVLAGVLFMYFSFWAPSDGVGVEIDPFWANIIRFVTVIASLFTLALVAFLFDNDAHHAESALVVEHERSEKLLLNVLPPSISHRLKSGQESIADGFGEVSVLFADIVGFTELSAKLPPEALVEVLSEVFSRFDDLAEEHGIEKIKTIGDAYMVAAGLPEPRADHAVAVTRMAMAMKDVLHEVNRVHGHALEVRIGINSGPVVAGVIGKKKFIYDLWGDTVNTASRMESHGQKSVVHVSETTAALIEKDFELECRGTIHVKGKGDMRTYFVLRARDGEDERRAASGAPKSVRELEAAEQ